MTSLPSSALYIHVDEYHIAAWAGAIAPAVHLACNRHEPNILLAIASLVFSILCLFATLLYAGHSFWYSLLLTNIASTSFAITLFTSISIYRLFLSPLRNFPGPNLAAVSKLWYIYHSAGGGMPKVVRELHEKYGDIVRIGPDELSIRSMDAVEVVLGSKGRMNKGPWYDAMWADKGGRSVHALKSVDEHAQRRKIWDKAMSGSAMKEYVVFLKDCLNHLCHRLREDYKSNPVQDVRRVMNHLVFDVIGEITCARSFGMIEKGEDHTYIHFIERGMRALTCIAELPWIIPLLSILPVVKAQTDAEEFSMKATMDRYKKGWSRPDLFSYFVQDDGQLQRGH